MIDMDYEKKYNEALERAQKATRAGSDVAMDIVQYIFPELAESEDERVRKFLLDYAIEMIAGLESDISRSTYNGIKGHDPESEAELAQWQKARAYLEKPAEWSEEDERIRKELIELVRETVNEPNRGGITVNKEEKYIAYLEKQKINTEGDFGRGYDCGYQAGYTDAMNEMKPKVATATLDSEKQKESLHIPETCKENADSFTDDDERIRKAIINYILYETKGNISEATEHVWVTWLEKQKEQKPDDKCKGCNNVKGCINCVDGSEWAHIEEKEQKPAWSEEDERKRLACIETINEVIDYERERWEDCNPGKPYRPIMKYDEQVDWLKSLHPRWKPSEEQMEALRGAVNKLVKSDVADSVRLSIMYDNLKKLM